MLCPKGVKRYLQGSHPDRLTDGAAARHVGAVGLQRRCRTSEAIARVAAEIARIQQTHGAGAIGVLGGASLTTEKTYLLGKFARVCLKTPFIDYNGRLCMVSAGAANKKAFGIDRTTNPWSDMVGTEVIWVAGSNVAECSPITTNYIWQAREQGAKIIVQDPRITPVARTCDLYLPVKPGRDAALFAGVLQIMIERDWLDHAFIAEHTVGFEQVAEYCRQWTLRRTADVTGVPERADSSRPPSGGARRRRASCFHARGIEHHSNGVQNSLGTINLVLASGRIGQPKSGYGTIVGQANGQGGREHGQKCDQLPGWRDISNPEHRRVHRRRVGHRRAGAARARRRRLRAVPQDRHGRDQGPAVDLLQPEGLAARQRVRHALPREARVLRRHRLLPQRHGAGTPTSCCRAACTRRTRGRSRRSRDASSRSTRPWTVRARRARTGASSRTSPHALGRPHGFTFTQPARDLRGAARRQQGRRRRLLGRHLREDRAADGRLLALLQRGSADRRRRSTTIPARRACSSAAATTRSPRAAGRSTFPTAARASTSPTTARRSTMRARSIRSILTTGRVVSQFLSGTQTRRIGPLVKQYPEPRIEMHPRLAAKLGIADGDWATAETRRGDDHAEGAGRDDDSTGHDLHSVSLGRAGRARIS